MCCGDKRTMATQQAMNHPTQPAASAPAANYNPPASTSAAQEPAAWSATKLRYLERSPVRVRGPVTGKHYDFSAADPIALVEARDATALLRTRFFARAD